ncbi:hypothetical protein DFH06DRAFT_1134526 [Mycena polygramma]|nr:hypothetical protein DFH06DRAFT_1134526 [Mycena polygramma]
MDGTHLRQGAVRENPTGSARIDELLDQTQEGALRSNACRLKRNEDFKEGLSHIADHSIHHLPDVTPLNPWGMPVKTGFKATVTVTRNGLEGIVSAHVVQPPIANEAGFARQFEPLRPVIATSRRPSVQSKNKDQARTSRLNGSINCSSPHRKCKSNDPPVDSDNRMSSQGLEKRIVEGRFVHSERPPVLKGRRMRIGWALYNMHTAAFNPPPSGPDFVQTVLNLEAKIYQDFGRQFDQFESHSPGE